MGQVTEYATDWSNIRLNEAVQRNLNILDGYDFETLLLELSCNIKTEELSEETILKQFEESLKSKIDSAREIMRDNLKNVLEYELNDREE